MCFFIHFHSTIHLINKPILSFNERIGLFQAQKKQGSGVISTSSLGVPLLVSH